VLRHALKSKVSMQASRRRCEEFWASRLAAEGGDADSQHKLGIRGQLGIGMDVDMAQAAQLWRKTAEQGRARAQYHLGFWIGLVLCPSYPLDRNRCDQVVAAGSGAG
jgi:TPR repeat protein